MLELGPSITASGVRTHAEHCLVGADEFHRHDLNECGSLDLDDFDVIALAVAESVPPEVFLSAPIECCG